VHNHSALVLCFLSLLLGAHAFPETQEAKSARHIEQTIAALAQMTDADSLAAAGLLSLTKHREQSLPLIERALAASPTRVDLVWLQSEVCLKVESCDPVPIENRLRELDPSNAAGWAGALVRASSSNNEKAKDAVLAAIGHKDRFDIYWTTFISRLSDAVIRAHTMSPQEALVTIIGYQAAAAIPVYEAAAKACKGERLERAETSEACRGIASAFQKGDTYLTEMIGVAIAKRVWPEDSPEWKAAAEERRVYEYRSALQSKLVRREITHPGEYLTLCAQNRREQDAVAAQLIKDGKNPNPPAE